MPLTDEQSESYVPGKQEYVPSHEVVKPLTCPGNYTLLDADGTIYIKDGGIKQAGKNMNPPGCTSTKLNSIKDTGWGISPKVNFKFGFTTQNCHLTILSLHSLIHTFNDTICHGGTIVAIVKAGKRLYLGHHGYHSANVLRWIVLAHLILHIIVSDSVRHGGTPCNPMGLGG